MTHPKPRRAGLVPIKDPTLPKALQYESAGDFVFCPRECDEGQECESRAFNWKLTGFDCSRCEGEGRICRGCGEPPKQCECLDLPSMEEQEAFGRWLSRRLMDPKDDYLEFRLALSLFREEREG